MSYNQYTFPIVNQMNDYMSMINSKFCSWWTYHRLESIHVRR